MGKTFVEKILGEKAGKEVVPGEIVEVCPDIAMSHDNTAAIVRIFRQLGVEKIHDPDRHVIFLDHCVPAADERHAQNHKEIRDFVREQAITNFYDIGCGICHQVLSEEGFALPGSIIVGSDSHTTTYGAFGALSTGIGRTEMAVIFATGRIWLRVPESVKIELSGTLPDGISAKDVILKIIGDLGADGALYKSVQFSGAVVDAMSVSSRMVMTNMAVEMGAKNGYVEPDEKTAEFLANHVKREYKIVRSDADARYEQIYPFDLTRLEPQIACPHTVDRVKPVSAVNGKRIDQIFFGSCTNGRLEDFKVVADTLRGKNINPAVRMIVIPASRRIFLQALNRGYIKDLVEAGAVIANPGCGPCMGNHQGVPARGETVLSTSNRNFRGRFGCNDAEIYLSSPLTVAVSALTGKITDFRQMR
jgi:3-isopropylmalate/(R)-2-methylmalate dehydratase large subunit